VKNNVVVFATLSFVLGGCGSTAVPTQGTASSVALSTAGQHATFAPPDQKYGGSQEPIYFCDYHDVLWTVNTAGTEVTEVGSAGVFLTDVAFDPENGNLYGISTTGFYRVNAETGVATFIGNTGLDVGNALIFNQHGKAFAASYDTTDLYSIDVRTGAATTIGSNNAYESSGALTFYNQGLVLSGYAGSSNYLVWLNPKTAAVKKIVALDVNNLFGLASTGKGILYGFANTDFYRIYPTRKDIKRRTVLIVNLDNLNPDVANVAGAAYDGNFQQSR